MLTSIINAICALIAGQFPEAPVNVNNLGEGFGRPSFFVTHIQSATDDLNRWVYNNNILIQIVYFAPLDDYKNVDSLNQYDTFDQLKKIFAQGYFMVGDRAAKIKQLTGGPRNAEIYLTLNIDLTDEKVDTSTPAVIAGEINLNLQGGTE